jgi:hypothetical protein
MVAEAGPAVTPKQLSFEQISYQEYHWEIPMSGESETRHGAGPAPCMLRSRMAKTESGSKSGTQSVGADKPKKWNPVKPKQSALHACNDHCFFLHSFSNTWQPNEFMKRLKNLGASVQSYLDLNVDCIVSTSARTPSATPTGKATVHGAKRAKQIAFFHSTPHMTPAQFAKNHNKILLSPRK